MAPKATSPGEALRKSARACRAAAMASSVSRLVGKAQWALALWWIEVVGHRLDDLAGHLRPAGAVEVGDGLTVVAAFQGREVAADVVCRRGHAGASCDVFVAGLVATGCADFVPTGTMAIPSVRITARGCPVITETDAR